MPIERKLAAIMFTDIAGYTAQMSKDEAVAISLLNKKDSILKPLILEHNGTYVKSTGDGSLSHFNSAVDAATCAKRFQESIYDDKDLNVRVGVHLGDTIFEKGDIRGDGVNIASRLESMAVEGGVFVSKEVHDQLANQKEFEGVSLGLQSMKGVGRLIEVYGLKGDKLSEPNPKDYAQSCCPSCDSKSEVPSIAIIPFRNKGKKKDEFFAYGICSELISEVSSAKNTRVASKKQIEDAGNLSIDNLAKKLDVRYIVNGELWRMEDMFQLSIELYDSKEKKVIWLDNWEENWDNLPFIKSSLSNGILKVLNSSYLERNESIIKNSQAYEYYLKGRYKFEKRNNIEDVDVARELLKEAIKIDGSLTKAELLLGWTYFMMADYETAQEIFDSVLIKYEKCSDKRGMRMCYSNIGNVYFHKGEYDNALKYHKLANKLAKEIGDESGKILMSIGNIYFRMGNYEKALQNYNSELKFYENISDKLAFDSVKYNVRVLLANISTVYIYKGNYDVALKYLIRVHKISEEVGNKSWIGQSLSDIGMIYFDKGENEKGLEVLKEALPIQKDTGSSEDILCVAVYLALTYKYKNLNYDIKEIDSLIQKHYNIDFKLNYRLYQLLQDTSYLKTAYKQVQEMADNLEPDVKAKFLSYPIPKAIVEEWEKVK